ncbi:MAG: class I SAM-dependent methyltransferase [Phycisphaerae bacterium]|nr:class I SAM-dependent methyltransferase [Phycisphaerae bacterium]
MSQDLLIDSAVQLQKREALVCYHLGAVQDYLRTSPLLGFLWELIDARDVLDRIEQGVQDVDFFRTKHWDNVFELGLYRILNYVLVRALRPKVFLETGVLHGLTSSFILGGLARNGRGKLISIDLPSYFDTGPANQDGYDDTLPPGKEPGWVIHEDYRPHWQLVLGRSLEEMPKLLKKTGPLDVFLHDSEHTYETMWGELNLAWDALKPGGVLLCDNIDANTAFTDFCARVAQTPLLLPEAINVTALNEDPRFGLIRK